ncbi:MAG TPA: hypothetical protein VFF73_24575 [Planctomycetota bacterium]|nr:hypothetical protein [Planctomycetota bacterium]
MTKIDFSQPSRRELKLQKLLAGIDASIADGDAIKVDGTSYAKADLRSKVAGFLAPEVAARQGHLTQEHLIDAKKQNEGPADAFADSLKKALITYFGKANKEVLGTFGVTPPKPRKKLTAAETVVKSAKAAETRQARGTKGPKLKASIQGAAPASVDVTAGKIVPVPGSQKGGTATS